MMNKKNLSALFCAMLILATGLLTSCKDYDDDIAGLDDRVADLEADVKALQGKLEDAIANGCWIEYYEIDQATGNCTLHFLGKEETLEIPSVQGKDAIVRHFKVNNDTWQYAAGDGIYSNVLKASDNSPVKVTVNDGVQDIGNISVQTVETPDNGEMQVIFIGNVQTTIRCDKNDPILAVDEESKYMLVSVGGVHYTLLLEGSTFKGLQSVAYRRTYATDDVVEAMTLLNSSDDVIASSPAKLSFRVLPKEFKLAQAKFECDDIRELKTRASGPSLSYIQNSAELKDGILSLSIDPQNMEDGTFYGAVLNVTLNGYTTTSDDFVVRKSTQKVSDAKVFSYDINGDKQTVDNEHPLVIDDDNKYYLSNLNCGFEVGTDKSLASLQNLGFDVTVKYTLDEEAKSNFTVGNDDNGDYLSITSLSDKAGNITITYKLGDEQILERTIPVKSQSLNIMLNASGENATLADISSLYKSSVYVPLSSEPLNVDEMFSSVSKIGLGYKKDGKLVLLDKEKVYLTNKKEETVGALNSGEKEGTNESSLYLCVNKQTDLDDLTDNTGRRPFDLYLMAENGGALQVEVPGEDGVKVKKSIYLKGVNFYYQPYVKAKEEFVDRIIFDGGKVENNKIDMTDFPKASIKGKAIVGRPYGEQQYSFENISFSDLYEWSPKDYVTFSISKGDQTDFLQTEWGKAFTYNEADGTFSVKLPCNLRKLNFGNDQKAEKKSDVTVPNTDPSMIEKGGNEGLKIHYIEGDKEVIDNWYFLDPISSPGDRWFYFHYRFNLFGADQVYCYEGSTAAGTEIDILKCLTNTEDLSAANAEKLKAFTSNMAWDWYFDDWGDGTNNIVKVVNEDGVSKIVVSEAAQKKYGEIKVTFDKTDKPENFEFNDDYATSFKVKNKVDYDGNAQIKLKITTQFGEQQAMFKLKKH